MAMAYAGSRANHTTPANNMKSEVEENVVIWHTSQTDKMNCSVKSSYKLTDYTVYTSLSLIVLFCMLSILFHIALLLAIKLKQSTHKLYFGLYITVSVVDFAFCVLWLVIEGVVIAAGILHMTLPYQLCYLHGALFSMGSSAILVSLTFLTIHRIGVLHKSSNGVMYVVVIAGIIATVVLPLIFTFTFTMDYSMTIPYHLCVYNCYTVAHMEATPRLGIFMTIGVVVLFLIVLIPCAIITVQIWNLACEIRTEKLSLCQKRHSLQKLTLDSNEFVESNQDSQLSHSSHRVTDSNSSAKPKVVFAPDANPGDDEDDIDDTFDMRMRQKLARNTSGRRHTVANIGDNPLRQMRRGSYNELNNGKGNNSYNYIRKWSVDITALQDQLENPKIHGEGFPFRELSFLKVKDGTNDENEDKPSEESQQGSSQNIASDTSTTEAQDTLPVEVPKSKPNKPKKKVNMQDSHDAIQIIPSIVVEGNNANQDEFVENDEEVEQSKIHHLIKSLTRQLHCGIACLFLTLLTIAGFLPYYVILLIPHSPNIYISVNLGRIAAAICVFPVILHPLFFTCLEKKIYQAFGKLKYNLEHCKCVCYCNLSGTQWKPAMTQTENGI